MAVAQHMSEADYVEFVSSGVEGRWELHDGRLVEKPGMSWRHLDVIAFLVAMFHPQLNRMEYRVFTESRVRRPRAAVLMPDVAIVPAAFGKEIEDLPILAVFTDPLPLIIEVWSPSTGDYDVERKIPVYMQRGDREIWRIHPYERTLTRRVRQPDGTYEETVHRGGTIAPVALPGVTIDLDALFAG